MAVSSISFCADCSRPISAGAMRCLRCCNALKRRTGLAPAKRQRRAISARDVAAIAAADSSIRDVDLAWRYGVGVATISRIRSTSGSLTG